MDELNALRARAHETLEAAKAVLEANQAALTWAKEASVHSALDAINVLRRANNAIVAFREANAAMSDADEAQIEAMQELLRLQEAQGAALRATLARKSRAALRAR